MTHKKKLKHKKQQSNLRELFVILVTAAVPLLVALISLLNDTVGLLQLLQSKPIVVFICGFFIVWTYCLFVSIRKGASTGTSSSADISQKGILRFAPSLSIWLPFLLLVGLGFSRFVDGNVGLTTKILLVIGFLGIWMISFDRLFDAPEDLERKFKRPLPIIRVTVRACLLLLPVGLVALLWASTRPGGDKIILVAKFSAIEPIIGNVRINESLSGLLTSEFEDEADVRVKFLGFELDDKNEALRVGKDYNAALVIWGSYVEKPNNSALLYLNFETPCLRCPIQYFSDLQQKPRNIKEIDGFDFELSLSDELANLSFFTLGLVQYQEENSISSIATFSKIINKPTFGSLSPQFQSLVYFYRGISLEKTEQPDKALDDLTNAASIDSTNGLAHMWLGSMLYDKGNYLEAINHYNVAVSQNVVESCKYIYMNRGHAYYMAEQYELAIDDYEITIQMLPDYHLAYYELGQSKYQLQDYESAVNDYGKAIELASDNPSASYFASQGNAYLAMKNYQEALEHYDDAIAIDDTSGVFFNNRGNAYYGLENYDQALLDYELAIKLDPSLPSPHLGKGNVYFDRKKYKDAFVEYDAAVKIDPNYYSAYQVRGKSFYLLNDFTNAVSDYSNWIRLRPNDSKAFFERGLALYFQKDYTGAIEDFSNTVRLDPAAAGAYRNRGLCYAELENYENALKDATSAIELSPQFAEAYLDRGRYLVKQGNLDDAESDFNRVLEISQDSELRSQAKEQLALLGR